VVPEQCRHGGLTQCELRSSTDEDVGLSQQSKISANAHLKYVFCNDIKSVLFFLSGEVRAGRWGGED